MLVLERKRGEMIRVGNGALIVLHTSSSEVRLGLRFDRDTVVCRAEADRDGYNEAALHCAMKYREWQLMMGQRDARP